jgi:hypothetical protein
MTKVKLPKPTQKTKPRPGKQYPGVHGKVVDWAEHIFEEGNLYLRVRFADQTELCWSLQTAHVIVEADLGDWRTGDFKQLAVYTRNESDWES